jgi:hypothetical protein
MFMPSGADSTSPLKLEKIWFFWRKIVIFHTKYPNNFRASLCIWKKSDFFGVKSCPPESAPESVVTLLLPLVEQELLTFPVHMIRPCDLYIYIYMHISYNLTSIDPNLYSIPTLCLIKWGIHEVFLLPLPFSMGVKLCGLNFSYICSLIKYLYFEFT